MHTWTPVKRVVVPGAAEPAGATWSNCLVLGNEVMMSGVTAQSGTDDAGRALSTEAQGRLILERIDATMRAAGGSRANIYKLVVYLTDIADKEAVSQLRAGFFGPVFPCSTLVQVSALAFPGLTIEIDAFGRLDCDVAQAMQYYPGQYYPG